MHTHSIWTIPETRALNKRRMEIAELVSKHERVKVHELCQQFGASEVTIRRDLRLLEQAGFLHRVHGGAVRADNGVLHQSHSVRMHADFVEKKRIGQAAAALVQPNDRIMLDSGTTVLQVARHISHAVLEAGNLTVITGSAPIIQELGARRGVHLIFIGGIYLPSDEVVVGPQAIASLKGLHADKMFCGADGITLSNGLTTSNLLEAEVDRTMLQAASRVIAVASSSKIGRIGLATILPLQRLDMLITDAKAPLEFVDAIRDMGVEVLLV